MADKDWRDKFVKCPFYVRTTKNKIICEGFISNSALHLSFGNPGDRQKYMEGICYRLKGCCVCPINKMLTSMYEVTND